MSLGRARQHRLYDGANVWLDSSLMSALSVVAVSNVASVCVEYCVVDLLMLVEELFGVPGKIFRHTHALEIVVWDGGTPTSSLRRRLLLRRDLTTASLQSRRWHGCELELDLLFLKRPL